MKRFLLILLLSIYWTLAAAQGPLPDVPEPVPTADTAAADSVSGTSAAPVRMTLNDCMAYAVEHSPAVRRQDYTNRNYRQDYIESVASLVPSLSGTVGASTSFGRSVDPETNTYTDVSNLSNNYSVSGQMPLCSAARLISCLS